MKGHGRDFHAMFDTLGTDHADRSHEQQAATRAVLLRVDQGRFTADEGHAVLAALGFSRLRRTPGRHGPASPDPTGVGPLSGHGRRRRRAWHERRRSDTRPGERMSVHRCPTPAHEAGVRAWSCPDCEASYVWSKRYIGREVREGWERTIRPLGGGPGGGSAQPFTDRGARLTGSDAQFDRWFTRAAILAGLYGMAMFAVVVGLIVWVVLQVTW